MNNTKLENFDSKSVNMEELYYQALFIAFKRFIEEEKAGNFEPENRLMVAIKAAKTLYKNPIYKDGKHINPWK